MIGIILSILVLDIFGIWCMFLLTKYIKGKKLIVKKEFITFLILLVSLAISVGYGIYDVYNLKSVSDFSKIYDETKDINVYKLYTDKEYHIIFNSNYDNDYVVSYDDTLNDEFKVEITYYKNYYDLYSKKKKDSLYISFHDNKRNIISTLIEGLKNNEIYNLDELNRYEIKIYMNKQDKKRVLIDN